jgi:uncharacterized protein YndB with AHSA1/START domain
MSSSPPTPPIRATVTVDAPAAEAFAAFTEGINAWWPREFSWCGQLLERQVIEPWRGGFCHEVGPYGLRLDWGRVSTWEPPQRLGISWQISPDRTPEPSPAHASEVVVRFEPLSEERTRVVLRHEGWDRHGPAGAEYRRGFAESGAWRTMLRRYARVVANRREAPWTGLTT